MKSRWSHSILLMLLILGMPWRAAASDEPKKTSKGLVFFFRIADKIDRFQLRGLDTAYITLPEYSWRVAFTGGSVGVNAAYTTWHGRSTDVTLYANTSPSFGLGFNVGYRGYGGGYSWDVLNAYTTNWNVSFGSKIIGIEFIRNISTNLTGDMHITGSSAPWLPTLSKGDFRISNSYLGAWYALNAAHYSHNAAIKQSYIQKKTAGSLLLSVAYMSSQMAILDTAKYIQDEEMSELFDGVTGMVTRQVALGIGYGINYTPNKGKVLLHASANMQLVCYSINHVSYASAKSTAIAGTPQYEFHPAVPVHVTGNMRAAVSWEINKWVHLSAWGQVNNLRFASNGELSRLQLSTWNWQANLNIGVRFGAGKKRMREVLNEPEIPGEVDIPDKKTNLPRWVTDFFFSTLR